MNEALLSIGKVAVVGAGAVGAYYGGRLAAAGADVRFLVRRDLEIWRQHGLRVRSVAGDFTIHPVAAAGSPAGIGPCDLVIIALKATANDALDQLIPPLLGPDTRLLTLQNGLGNDALLATKFGAERVMGGLCFVCINRSDDGIIHHLGEGHVSLGNFSRPVDQRLREVADAFKASGVPARVVDELAATQWRKLVWNIPFNGLAVAMGGVDCAAILSTPEGEARVRALMAEVIDAATVFGYTMPEDLIEQQLQVTRAMGPYRPSTLIDFLDGRPIELDAIWGEPLRRARAAGLAMPELERLIGEIRRNNQNPKE
jgi:2-dehydropantoate 2-reductase